MDIPLLPDIVTIFSLSIIVLLVCHRFKIPSVVGYLLTGVICGPHGFALVSNINDVKILADIGLIFLLFTVGMELSLKKIFQHRQHFLVAGSLQVFFTVLAGMITAKLIGRPWGESIFLGFLLSLSSTAIVIRLLEQKNEIKSPHGQLTLGILVFQDFISIPMMLLVPLLSGYQAQVETPLFYLFIKGAVILLIVVFIAVKIVPKLLDRVASTRSRELFLLCVLAICFSVAWLSSSIGLSLSLGAFLAGLVIAESEYSNQAIGDILPFQDIFTSFFFVSIGMLLDLQFVISHPGLILFIAAGVILLKSFLVGLCAFFLKMPIRTVVLTAIALSQVGEFSFVLAKSGMDRGIATEYHYQLFLAISLFTMAMAPGLIGISHNIADFVYKLPLPEKIKMGLIPNDPLIKYTDHIIIVGFGLSGQNVAKSARQAKISYFILEMNPDIIKKEREKGEPIHFGDASNAHVLHHAHIEHARSLAVVVNDPIAALRIVKLARELNPKLYIIVRTRYLKEVALLYKLGANDVIPDEFGASIEIFTRILTRYAIPFDDVEKFVKDLRMEGYEQLQLFSQKGLAEGAFSLNFKDSNLETLQISNESPLVGKTLIESQLRKKYGITVLLIKRENQTIAIHDPNISMEVGDIIVVVGSKESLERAKELFKLHLRPNGK